MIMRRRKAAPERRKAAPYRLALPHVGFEYEKHRALDPIAHYNMVGPANSKMESPARASRESF